MNPKSFPGDLRSDRPGRDELIRRHLPLAYRLAACYRSTGRPYENLVQIAEIGLVRAAEQFDPGLGESFRAFAGRLITRELRVRGVGEGRTAAAQRRVARALGASARVGDLARMLEVDRDVLAGGLAAAAEREAVTLNLPAARRVRRLHCAAPSVTPAAA